MWYFDQCDPKKCSGMHLKRQGMLKTLPITARYSGVVLTPAATKMISLEDAELLEKNGVCVIDCSWAFFETVKVKSIKSRERILPNLLAANTINYGKEFKLSCAEALAAACFLAGFEEQAHHILSEFKWGPAFFAINEFRLS
jgi:pre-rRNA-processing protein TSR3